VIEVAAQIPDFVIAVAEADGHIEIASADGGDLLLEFDHRALDEVGQHADRDSADDDGSSAGEQQECVAIGAAQSQCGNGKQDQTREKHEYHGQDCLDLPIDTHVVHGGNPLMSRAFDPTGEYARCFPDGLIS
jgi:hypothetical protein